MALYAKYQDVCKSARLAASQFTGLSTAHPLLLPNVAAPECGLSGVTSTDARPCLTLAQSYMPHGDMHNPFQCFSLPPTLQAALGEF
jgi:hypothetical protein